MIKDGAVEEVQNFEKLNLKSDNNLYKVIGIRDICDLDDKPFVRQRRKRDKIVTIMYFIVVLAFVFSMYFMASLLGLIL